MLEVFYSTLGLFLKQVLGDTVHLGAAAVGISSFTATLLFVRNGISVLAGPTVGWVSDRLGERTRVLLLGEILGVIGFVCLALGRSLWLLLPAVIAVAIAYAIVPPMLVAWMGDVTHAGRRGGVVGGFQTAGDIGSGLGPLVAYSLIEALGAATVYGSSAGLLALTVPVLLRSRRHRRAIGGSAAPMLHSQGTMTSTQQEVL